MSRAEYERLIDPGLFQPGAPVELIGGELVIAEPQDAAHDTAVVKTARALEAAFGPGWHVRTQGPIGLDDDSEPEPDVAVHGREHPSRPALIVEVSESSLGLDRGHKSSLYARAGLSDYWVLNLVEAVLEVYRAPVPDAAAPFGWGYAAREVLDTSGGATPLAAPGTRVHVSRLLP